MDAKLASQIEQGQIDALILLSCDPKGVNHQALMMAAKKQIPVTGTGGTSMANAQALVVGSSVPVGQLVQPIGPAPLVLWLLWLKNGI